MPASMTCTHTTLCLQDTNESVIGGSGGYNGEGEHEGDDVGSPTTQRENNDDADNSASLGATAWCS
eukprot:4360527-Pleurochrysis_carterae.AAC.1